MADAVAAEYRTLTEQAVAAREEPAGQRRSSLTRLRRELRRIRARDYFPPTEREQALQAASTSSLRWWRSRSDEVGDAPRTATSTGPRAPG